MWLPRTKRWTLIDFGCAARVGEFARTGFSLFFAAPEAIVAYTRGAGGLIAKPGLDSWSLGILAIEMFTGRPAFDVMRDKNEVCNQASTGRLTYGGVSPRFCTCGSELPPLPDK